MPSTVVISWPSIATPRARHESMRRPSTSTAQHPHSPNSQPCFVPVSLRSSRSVLCGENATSTCSPLTRNTMCAFWSLLFAPFPTCFITLPRADTIWQQDSSGQVLKLKGGKDPQEAQKAQERESFLRLLWFLSVGPKPATGISFQHWISFVGGFLRRGICRVNAHQ